MQSNISDVTNLNKNAKKEPKSNFEVSITSVLGGAACEYIRENCLCNDKPSQ